MRVTDTIGRLRTRLAIFKESSKLHSVIRESQEFKAIQTIDYLLYESGLGDDRCIRFSYGRDGLDYLACFESDGSERVIFSLDKVSG